VNWRGWLVDLAGLIQLALVQLPSDELPWHTAAHQQALQLSICTKQHNTNANTTPMLHRLSTSLQALPLSRCATLALAQHQGCSARLHLLLAVLLLTSRSSSSAATQICH
jgi:hypothetical protein